MPIPRPRFKGRRISSGQKQAFKYLLMGAGLAFIIKILPHASFLLVWMTLRGLHRRDASMLGMLVLMMAMSISNHMFFPRSLLFVTAVRLSFGIMALAGITRLLKCRNEIPFKKLNYIFLYLFFAIISSLLGWNPLISFMKIFLFSVFQIALFSSASLLARRRDFPPDALRVFAFALILFFVFGSLALTRFPSIGSTVLPGNSFTADMESLRQAELRLFKGVTWHAQTLGPVLAILNAFSFAELLRKPRRHRWFYLATLAVIPYLILFTGSRTGLISYAISIGITLFWQGQIPNKSKQEEKQRNAILLILLIMGPIYLFAMGGVTQIQVFLRKGAGEDATMAESLVASRLELTEYSYRNFLRRPVLGNGFQVTESMRFYGFSSLGLAASAPIEKGVLPTMILEEGGVIGFAVFAAFVLSVLGASLRFGCLRFLATFSTFLALNSGEATFFSVTGPGGLYWTICVLALVIDWKEDDAARTNNGLILGKTMVFKRARPQKKLLFYNIATASIGEARSLLCAMEDKFPGPQARLPGTRTENPLAAGKPTGLITGACGRQAFTTLTALLILSTCGPLHLSFT